MILQLYLESGTHDTGNYPRCGSIFVRPTDIVRMLHICDACPAMVSSNAYAQQWQRMTQQTPRSECKATYIFGPLSISLASQNDMDAHIRTFLGAAIQSVSITLHPSLPS